MTWDYYVYIAEEIRQETTELSQLEGELKRANRQERSRIRNKIKKIVRRLREEWKQNVDNDAARMLVAQILDDASIWWFGEYPQKESVRTEIYMPIASTITIAQPGTIADDVDFRPDFNQLLSPRWLGLQVDFELLTPWYSRDDRLFHVMDNPVRKDRVFGVPFMAASSWKGMLRWAFRMVTGLIGPEQEVEENKRKKAKDIELYLFGNEKGEEKDFHQGVLVFYPTWFNKIGFEVINPHRRATRAGTQPIYYEVVPGRRIEVRKKPDGRKEKVEIEGAKGTLSLLYAPWPGMKHEPSSKEVLPRLLETIEALLTTYGISAKRTVGWGTARIERWRAFHKTRNPVEKTQREELWEEIKDWLPEGGTP